MKAELQSQAADYLAAAALAAARARTLADAEPVGEARTAMRDFLLTCRQYLDQHPDHPVFAKWRELRGEDRMPDGIARSITQPLFAEALARRRKGPAYRRARVDRRRGFLAFPDKDADVLDAATLDEDRGDERGA